MSGRPPTGAPTPTRRRDSNSGPATCTGTSAKRLTLVGTVVLNNGVVQDDIDAGAATTVIATPALTRQLVGCCSNFSFTYLQLQHGSQDVPAVEAEVEHVVPAVLPYDFYDASIDVIKAQNAIKPEAIALAVFGLIAGLAAILIAGQLIARQLGFWAPEERTLRALGADPGMTVGDGLVGIMAAVVLGALLAGTVAVALSPLSPLGPVRPVYPHPGVAADWAVLGSRRAGAGRRPRRAGRRAGRPTRAAPVRRRLPAKHAGTLPRCVGRGEQRPAGRRGRRHPLRPRAGGRGRRRAGALGHPRRRAGRHRHRRHRGVRLEPQLPGVPPQPLRVELGRRADRRWRRGRHPGRPVGEPPRPRPPGGGLVRLLVRHAAARRTCRARHRGDTEGNRRPRRSWPDTASTRPTRSCSAPGPWPSCTSSVGDTVTVRYGTTAPHSLRIVGTATMPAVGIAGVTGHPSMGTGAVVPYQLIPASVRNQFAVTPTGPNAVFVRLKPGVNRRRRCGRSTTSRPRSRSPPTTPPRC